MNIRPTKLHNHTNYLAVFGALAVLTALEVGATYLPLPRIAILLPIALIKASLVAMYFMHLKTDHHIYRYFFFFGILMGFILIGSLIIIYSPRLIDA